MFSRCRNRVVNYIHYYTVITDIIIFTRSKKKQNLIPGSQTDHKPEKQKKDSCSSHQKSNWLITGYFLRADTNVNLARASKKMISNREKASKRMLGLQEITPAEMLVITFLVSNI